MRAVEGRAILYGDENIVESMTMLFVVVDIAGRHDTQSDRARKCHQRTVAISIADNRISL